MWITWIPSYRPQILNGDWCNNRLTKAERRQKWNCLWWNYFIKSLSMCEVTVNFIYHCTVSVYVFFYKYFLKSCKKKIKIKIEFLKFKFNSWARMDRYDGPASFSRETIVCSSWRLGLTLFYKTETLLMSMDRKLGQHPSKHIHVNVNRFQFFFDVILL